MNKVMYDRAMAKLDSMTTEELGQSLIDAGFDVVHRQYPEPEMKQNMLREGGGHPWRRRTERDAEAAGEPFHYTFLEPVQDA